MDKINYNFISNAQFSFQCDASNYSNYFYIDQVIVSGIIGNSFRNPYGISNVNDNAKMNVELILYPIPVIDGNRNIKLETN